MRPATLKDCGDVVKLKVIIDLSDDIDVVIDNMLRFGCGQRYYKAEVEDLTRIVARRVIKYDGVRLKSHHGIRPPCRRHLLCAACMRRMDGIGPHLSTQ